ncbi:MAG: hypothetical protein RBU37_21305, partial [Myxococcota bacterium]|nr:hypothetical protein [Myxococcota bacterium]
MNNLPPFSLSSSQQPPTRGPALRRHLCPRSLRLAGCLLGLGLFACSPRSVVEEEAPSPPAEQLSSDAEEVPILDDQKAPALPHDTWLPISTIAAPEARV